MFYTTEKVSQPKKAQWAEKILEKYGYELVVFSRADIIATLQLPENAQLCRTHLNIPIPYQPPITDLLRQTRDAASTVAANWAAHPRLTGKPQIALNAVALDERGGDTREFLTTSHLRTLLLQGRRIVLEGPAGRGKTTTLIQLAQANGASYGIPILIDLPNWIRSGSDILEYVVRSPAFRALGIDADALARVQQAEPYLFLLNGWNEIAELYSQAAADALRSLERAFPKAGIIVATRTHHFVPPLPGSVRFRLLPLTPDQRYQYLVKALGTGPGQKLNSKLSRDHVLDELTRTPFVLSEVTTIFRAGNEIPQTKLGLLSAVVGLIEHSEEHNSELQAPPLRGRAEDYLRTLSTHLTARGDVILTEPEARSICYSVSEALRNIGQIAATPEPSDVLNALTSHHILERIDYPGTSFRFEHQQIQEYYSAVVLRSMLRAVVASGDLAERDKFTRKYINDPAWEEPLRMIAEDLGAAESEIPTGKVLVQTALRVDPVFAARLSHFGGPSIWSEVRSEVDSRLRALYAVPNQRYRQYALAAMLATGSDDFADILIPLLTDPDQQVRLGAYRAGLQFPSSIGQKWERTVAGWTEQHRIEFVTQLAIHQGRTEVALKFVRSDPSPAVRLESLSALVWMGQREEVTEILRSLSDPEFERAIQKLYPNEIPPALRERSISTYKALLAVTGDPKVRLQITLALAELDDSDTPTRLKSELNVLPAALVKELSEYTLRPAIDILRQADPQWLSQWVTNHIIEGVLWRDNCLSLISGIPKSLSERLLQRARTEDLRSSGGRGYIAVLAATADPEVGKAIFMAVRDHHRALLADPQNQEKQTIGIQLRGLLRSIPRSVVVEGLSDVLAQEPQDDELAILTDLFSGMGAVDDDVNEAMPDHLRQRLRKYFKFAIAIVLAQDDFRGEVKGRLSLALAEVGEPDDMADLIAMTRADINRVREGRAAWGRGERSAKAEGSPMCWSGWHVQALIRLGYTQSEAILLELLNEPEYELDAAWGLQVMAKNAKPGFNSIRSARFGQLSREYKKISSNPADWFEGFNEELRVKYAAAIRQRILNVLGESKTGDYKTIPYHYRLKELAKVLASLDPKASADLVLDIAMLPARSDGWLRCDLLEALVFAHVALPADRVLAVLDPVFGQFRAYGIYNDNAHLLGRLLCLLPFVDPPSWGIARIRDLMSEFRLPLYNQGNLLMALGQCPDDSGLALLCDVARQNDAGLQNFAREWLEAIAACPLPGAKAILLGFVDPEVKECVGDHTLPDYALDSLAGRISDLARANSSIAERIAQLSTQPLSGQRRLILAKVIAWLGSRKVLLAGLNLIDDSSPQPVPYELWKAIEDVFLEKRPYKGNLQAYDLVPQAATDIKERLFDMVRHDPRRARSAYDLLGQIEEWRLEYGRPTSEPRHPLYESGEMWPLVEPTTQENPAGNGRNAT